MKLLSYLFGEDLFISYSRADATAYAATLANQLSAKGFSCFLDQWETEPGQAVPKKVLRTLGRSSMLVLVASPAGVRSAAVQHEVRHFLATRRAIIPISVDKALEGADWFHQVAGAAISAEDGRSLADGEPSPAVLTRVESSFRFTKRNRRVQIGFGAAALGLLALIAVASWSTMQARTAQQAALRSSNEAKLAEQTAQRQTERARQQEEIARVNLLAKQQQQAIAEAKAAEAERQASAAQRSAALAERQRQIAEQRQQLGRARLLMYESRVRAQTDPALALLLAAQAERERPSVETTDHLTDMLNTMPALQQVIHGHRARIIGIGMAADASRLVSVDESGVVIVRQLGAADAPRTWDLGAKLSAAALSPTGQVLAYASGQQVRLLDLDTGQPLPGDPARQGEGITSLCFTPDGRMLVSGSWDNTAALWRVGAPLELLRTLKGHRDRPRALSLAVGVHACALTADGRVLATGGGDGDVRLWDLPEGTPRDMVLKGAANGPKGLFPGLSSLAFSDDGQWLATGAGNAEIQLWNARTGQPMGPSLRGHRGRISALAFGRGGHVLFSAGEDGSVRAWRVSDQAEAGDAPMAELTGHRGAVTALHVDARTGLLHSGGSDGRLLAWQPFNRQNRLARSFIHPGPSSQPFGNPRTGRRHFPDVVSAVTLSRSGRLMASAADDGSVVVWDLASGRELDRFQPFRDTVLALAIGPDDATLAVGGANDSIVVRRIGSSGSRWLNGHGLAVGALNFSADGQQLAAGTRDGGIAVWQLATATRTRWLPHAHRSGVSLIRFGRRPGTLLSGGLDGRLALWDPQGDTPRREASFDTRGSIEHLGYASATGTVIVRTRSGLSFWDSEHWRPARPDLPMADVERVAISPDGQAFATEHQAQLTVWQTRSGERVSGGARLWGATSTRGSVSQMVFGPDNQMLATVGASPYVLVWDIRPQARVLAACAVANRAFTDAERREFGLVSTTGPCPGRQEAGLPRHKPAPAPAPR